MLALKENHSVEKAANIILCDLEKQIESFFKEVGHTIRSMLQYKDDPHVLQHFLEKHKLLLARIEKKMSVLTDTLHKQDLQLEFDKLKTIERILPLVENAIQYGSLESVTIPEKNVKESKDKTMKDISEWTNRILENMSSTLLHPERIDKELQMISDVYFNILKKLKYISEKLTQYEQISKSDSIQELKNRASTLQLFYAFLQYFKTNTIADRNGSFDPNNLNMPPMASSGKKSSKLVGKKLYGKKIKSSTKISCKRSSLRKK
jgi:hypothetical protein